MIFVVALALTFLVYSLAVQFKLYSYPLIEPAWGRIAAATVWGGVGALIGVLLGVGTAIAADFIPNQSYCDNPVNVQLYSMGGETGTAGSFLFIDTEYSYHYFTKSGDEIAENDLGGSMGRIYEDSTPDTAHVATFSMDYNWYWRSFVIGGGGASCFTQFHVPPGSVSRAIQAAP